MNKGAVGKAGWQRRRVADIAQHSLGKMLDKAKNKGEPRPYLRNLNVRWFEFDLSDVLEMRFLPEEASKYTAVKGDLLICEGGYPGRAAIWDQDNPIYFQKALHRVRFYQPEHTQWFQYYLYALDLAGTLKKHFNSAGIQHFTGEALAEFEVPLAPLPDIRRMTSILDEAFDGIATAKANAEKNLQNARALFESHLQAVFTQRGEGWVEKPLGEICRFSSGGTPSKTESRYWNGSIPWISGRDMKSTRLSDAVLHISQEALDESSTRMAPAGALLTLVRGMGLAHGAQIAELMVPCAFNQDIRAIHPERNLAPRFLLFALRTGINHSGNVLSNAAHGTLKIDMYELSSVAIPVPSRVEQERVVRQIDALDAETQRLASLCERKLTALDALKKSLLDQAFTGVL